jgi:flagellar basal-body rod protein FlgF
MFTAVSGAQHTLLGQQVRANNLANVNTTGFRADFERASAYVLEGDGYKSRVMAQQEFAGTDFSPGSLIPTGRDLDVAVQGRGFFAVEGADGQEAYTRAGNIDVDADGVLRINGRAVIGDGGEITLPPYRSLSFGNDGTISITPAGGGANLNAGRLKMVDPELADVVKGPDGLFRQRDGEELPASDELMMASGFLEGANVNAVEELIGSMTLSRTFELQVKLMKTADEQASKGAKLIGGK